MACCGGNIDVPAIGIDLGTTYSCVAVWKDNRIEIVPNEQGNSTTPSRVAFLDSQRLLIGDAANNQLAINPAVSTVFDAKRLIGRRFSDSKVQENIKFWPFRVIEGPTDIPKIVVTYEGQEKEFLAEEISSMVLGKMKEIAEAYVGNVVTNAVITVPSYFNDSQRQATRDAATIAGLNILRMINEPMAAAIAYGLDTLSSNNVLIFDLGAGTLDICLSTFEEGIFEVKASAGDAHLGGQDFDSRMVDHCVQEFKRTWKKDLTGNQRALGRLRIACEKAKRILSSTTQTLIELDSLHEGIYFSMEFTRDKFEELNMSLFKNCIKTLEKCLKDADVEKSLVEEIILVGGSTKIPKIQLMLQKFFNGKKLCKSSSVNPDEAVAYGAALMAAKLCGKTISDLPLFHLTPLSLGVQVTGEVFSIVIPRNTDIPSQRSRNYTTDSDNQTSILFKVYRGERSRSTDNHLLGELRISGIPPAPKGVPDIKVCFEIDAKDNLTVTAEIVSTGKKKKLVISHANGKRSKEEIEKMLKDAEKYKLEDQEHVKKANAYNALEDFTYDMNKKLKEYMDKKTVHWKCLKKMQDAVTDTTKWLKDNKAASVDKLVSRKEMLKESMEELENEKKLSWFGRLLLCFG